MHLISLFKNFGIRYQEKLKPDWGVIVRDKKISGNKIFLPMVVTKGVSKLVPMKISELKK